MSNCQTINYIRCKGIEKNTTNGTKSKLFGSLKNSGWQPRIGDDMEWTTAIRKRRWRSDEVWPFSSVKQ